MENKTDRTIIFIIVGIVLLAGAFSGGVLVGWLLPNQVTDALPILSLPTINTPVTSSNPDATQTPADISSLFKPFWQAWDLVHEQYVDQPVDDTTLMQGAIQGMLSSLGDPHTGYMTPDDFTQANAPLEGSYEGIGAYVDTDGEYLTIITPMVGSPAEAAGLKAGDQIIALNGEDVTGTEPQIVLRSVKGPAGTPVTLTVLREGVDPFDVTITRQKITIASVESKMLDGNIAYIQLNTFAEATDIELRAQLKDLLAQNPKGLILDLRYNGGGYLNTAVQVISEFIEDGTVLIEQYGDGSRETYEALPGGLATKIPLVVLVNEGSASASEITAGAIQDYGRGKLVGVQTYGKGSVQIWTELDNHQGAVRITVARWLTPKERQIHQIGLTPDFIVEITEADAEAGRDPQLDKAIELLNQ
jgi:carboxyl-terminal processing protease